MFSQLSRARYPKVRNFLTEFALVFHRLLGAPATFFDQPGTIASFAQQQNLRQPSNPAEPGRGALTNLLELHTLAKMIVPIRCFSCGKVRLVLASLEAAHTDRGAGHR